MVRACTKTADGVLLLLGLTPGNIARLRDGQLIMVDGAEMGAPGVQIAIMFGTTERSIMADLRAGGIGLPDDAERSVRDVERKHREKGTRP